MTEDNNSESHQENQAEGKEEDRSNVLEMIFTVLSLIIILTLVGYLSVQSFASRAPVTFELEVADPEKRGDFTAVEIQVANLGDEAAKAVNVNGEIAGASDKPVEAEATLDWLPGRSRRKVTLIFPGDVTTTTPEVNVTGYEEP